jgi:hypothetical protein
MYTDINVWPREVEQDYSDPAQYSMRIDDGMGSLDSFDNFLRGTNDEDELINDGLLDAFIEQFSNSDPPIIRNPEKEEEATEAARQQTRDAEYWPDPEEKKKQYSLFPASVSFQESRRRKMKLTKDILRELILEEIDRLYE